MARARIKPVEVKTRASARRDAILRAARERVAEVGFREAQMTAVADAADVALGTLYRYFPSKALLMIDVVASVSQREVDAAADAAGLDGAATVRLGRAAWTFAARALKGRRLAHALVAEPVDPEIEAERWKYRRKLARVFEAIINEGIERNELPVQNVQASAACMVGCLFDGLVGPLALNSRTTERERRDKAIAIVGFCLRGVSGRNEVFSLTARKI